MKSLKHLVVASSCAGFFLFSAQDVSAQTGEQVLNGVCVACHLKRPDGTLERIDSVRKTPEGWDMTVVRMMRNHQVPLSLEDRTEVVRYLASTRGLSIDETEGRRYVLEKEPVASDEAPNQLLTETCSRCHSFARVALQRRTADDWEKLLNFHLAQFPGIELQALARDRDWWSVVHNDVLPYLSTHFPLGRAPQPVNSGLEKDWVIAGHVPGKGDYVGTLDVNKVDDTYSVRMAYKIAGKSESFQGKAVLLGDGEWRATLTDGATKIQQVFALGKDGALSGRWFIKGNEVVGGRFVAIPKNSPSRAIGVSPEYARVGVDTEVTIVGAKLSGKVVFPAGMNGEVVSQTDDKLVIRVKPENDLGSVKIAVGATEAPLVVYSKLDRISVEPNMAVARVGGNGGPIPKTPAQFEAVGYLNGSDAKPGTADDVRVGVFSAKWSVDNWDEAATAMKDAQFAGTIDETGKFTPADAGPNPDRPMSTNNLGNLKVTAAVENKGQQITGEAHLYSTVQRFIDPPIR